jgi:hypothetical protein
MFQPSRNRSRQVVGFLGRWRLRPSRGRVTEKQQAFRPRLEALEDHCLLAVQMLSHYNGVQFYGSGGWLPPDTVGAAGPTSMPSIFD